jgi:type III pantothenate kinase
VLLLVDCGNTRVKWALAAPGADLGAWTDSGAVLHEHLSSLGARWRSAGVTRIVSANVAGEALQARLAAEYPPAPLWLFRSQAAIGPLRNAYRDSARLGADRFAAALGAQALQPGATLLVANCGTATTIDLVRADGLFTGGMILPGLSLMAQALGRHTAQLPMVAPEAEGNASFADHTEAAIAAGCMNAQAGAIERACRLAPDARLLLSGGAAAAIAPHLVVPYRMVDNIVLIGLQAAARHAPTQD